MAKRLTDTNKWEDPWFRRIGQPYQLFWLYLLDKCDYVGVWKVDFEFFEFYTGLKLTQNDVEVMLEDRIVVFDNKRKWFIPKFLTFQYGKLSIDSKLHRNIYQQLQLHCLSGLPQGWVGGYQPPKEKDKEKEQEQEKERKGGVGGNSLGVHFCHTCEKYFTESVYEKHLKSCRK